MSFLIPVQPALIEKKHRSAADRRGVFLKKLSGDFLHFSVILGSKSAGFVQYSQKNLCRLVRLYRFAIDLF